MQLYNYFKVNDFLVSISRDEFNKLDPYKCRVKCINEKAELFEIARALYHLNQRRGFKSNRRAGSSEDGKMFDGKPKEGITGINSLKENMKQGEFRTLGEYFASLDPHQQRIRSRYTLRDDYEFEWLYL